MTLIGRDEFDRWLEDWSRWPFRLSSFGRQPLETHWSPPVDVLESPTAITLVVEMPGVRREDLEIELEGDTLTLRGEKPVRTQTPGETFLRAERMYGRFERSFALGAPVDADGVEAVVRDGVLRLRIPKSERGPRRVRVE